MSVNHVIRKLFPIGSLFPKRFGYALIGLAGVLISKGLAVESFSVVSPFYTNSLTDPCSVLEDFNRFGSGFGSFEVNPQFGLELLSDSPDCYTGVRVLRTALPAGHSWQVLAKVHLDLPATAASQINPQFAARLGIAKMGRNCDRSTSILSTAPNRWDIGLTQGPSIGSGRRKDGVLVVDETFPVQLAPQSKDVILRFRYSADDKTLSVAYSVNGTDFVAFQSGGEDVNLGSEWSLSSDDYLVVYLAATSQPYQSSGDNDWWSAFDTSSPAPNPPPVCNISTGEISIRDLAVSYVPSPESDFQYTDNGEGVQVYSYTGQSAYVSVPHLIGGKQVVRVGAYTVNDIDIEPFTYQGITSIVLPATCRFFFNNANLPNLTSMLLPQNIAVWDPESGHPPFQFAPNLVNVNLPLNLILAGPQLGLSKIAYEQLVQSVGASLAENELFMAALASNEKFLGLLTSKLLSRFQSYGLAARSDLANLATKDDLHTTAVQSKAEGVNSVLNDPNSWSLYTTSQIQNMAIGDLLLQKGNSGNFTLYYDIEQSNDLKNWTVYQSYGEMISGLPTDKAFLRIRAKK